MTAARPVAVAALLRAALLVAAALAALPAAAQSAPDPAEQAAMLNAAEVVYARELTQLRAGKALNVDDAALARVRSAAEPLVLRAASVRPESGQWQWAANVASRDEPLLYCLPGGRILVSTGFLNRVRPTPAELSALLAHAIAHALDGHDGDEAAAQFARRRDAADADPNRGMLRLGDLLLKLMLAEPQLPDAEIAADALALELLASAALDPRSATTAWRKVAALTGARPPAFPALHPTNPERIAAMDALMPAMVARYEKARHEPVAPASPPPPTKGKSAPRGTAPAKQGGRTPGG